MQFKDVTDLEYFSKGRRGYIYTGIYNGKKVAIKAKHPESKAIGRIENEARWLEVLNKHGIGPKLVYHCPDYFIYLFIEGDLLVNYMKECSKEEAILILEDVFNQCFIMDKLGINKEEMHRPIKHILIEEGKPVMLDFERARRTEKPKNVTQFIQFISWSDLTEELKAKGININKDAIQKASVQYKKDISKKNFDRIISLIEG